ncbi:hypothetical protein MLD38_019849 [Melastoma candidum]|uniref:Uncharacterized protein n=1 Tax=Melastoma candidum TaxID=119954 RepID=A0ACB9QB78_9MYRT|nr:hypothetical protein MLD38_019849 [Melastoma candidum]
MVEDNMGELERNSLVHELTQGRDLTRQLQAHFHHASPSSSHEAQERLLLRILLSYNSALSMLSWNDASGLLRLSPGKNPTSRDFPEPDYKEHGGTDIDNNSIGDSGNNRKGMPRWTKRVRIPHGTAIEGQLDDGHSWRKYGQKDILRAKHPRGYYRCTNRGSQGCLATKQVQRSDEDPAIFEITYRGRHTCSHASISIDPSSSLPENENSNDVLIVEAQPQQQQHQQANLEQRKDHDELLDFYKSLAIITEGSSKNTLAAFSLPSIPSELHQLYPPFDAFNFSEDVTTCELFRENQNFHSQEDSKLDPAVFAASSVATSSRTNSRAADARGSLDYILDPAEFNTSSGNAGISSK